MARTLSAVLCGSRMAVSQALCAAATGRRNACLVHSIVAVQYAVRAGKQRRGGCGREGQQASCRRRKSPSGSVPKATGSREVEVAGRTPVYTRTQQWQEKNYTIYMAERRVVAGYGLAEGYRQEARQCARRVVAQCRPTVAPYSITSQGGLVWEVEVRAFSNKDTITK